MTLMGQNWNALVYELNLWHQLGIDLNEAKNRQYSSVI